MCTCITCSVLERNYFLTHILNASYDVKWNRMVIGLSFDIRVQFLLLKLGLTAWLVSSSFTADKWFLFFPLYNGKLLKYLFFSALQMLVFASNIRFLCFNLISIFPNRIKNSKVKVFCCILPNCIPSTFFYQNILSKYVILVKSVKFGGQYSFIINFVKFRCNVI